MAFPKAKRFDYKYSLTPAPTAYDVNPVSLNASFSFPQSKRFEPEAVENSSLAKSSRLSMSGTIFTRNPPKHNCLNSHQNQTFKEPSDRQSIGKKSTNIPQKVRKSDPAESQPLLQKEKTLSLDKPNKDDEIKQMVEEIKKELETCQTFLKNEEASKEFSIEDLNLKEKYEGSTHFSSAETCSISNAESANKKNLTSKNTSLNKCYQSLMDFTEKNTQGIQTDTSFPTGDIHREFTSLIDFSEAEDTKYFTPRNSHHSNMIPIQNNSNQSEIDSSSKDITGDILSQKMKNTEPLFTSSSDYIDTDREVFTSEENIFNNARDFKNSSAVTFDISEEFLYDDYQSLVEEDDMEMTLNLGNYEFSEVYKQFTKLYYNGSPIVLNPDKKLEAGVLEKTINNLEEVGNKENLPESVPINTVVQMKQIKTNIPTIPPRGVPMPPKGVPMPPKDLPMPSKGVPMPPKGVPMPPKGVPMPPKRVPMPPKGVPMPPKGVHMPPKGVPMSPNGVPNDQKLKKSQTINIKLQQKPLDIPKPPKLANVESEKPKTKKLVKRKPTKAKQQIEATAANHNQTDDQKVIPNTDEIERIVSRAIQEMKDEFQKDMKARNTRMLRFLSRTTVYGELTFKNMCDVAAEDLVKRLKTFVRREFN